ncbi:NAD-dependent epimerase/dehydratase family protein [Ruminiclostridium sufflavum DSM 19573]|uniref:NAD-dependent epimerase/dehydratase family protein n=2 Tax=Ruminiclostridium TaxID=1508657 RepID=A0A318XQ33_9FIRM|nr:NAD-dependent epimerase/dehydratase family protein [Ruminiclostridium sufflavum DSM 19573]
MRNEIIGVIGCGGKVGHAACEYLIEKGYRVKGGQRNPAGFSHSCFQWVKTDIYDEASLQAFCRRCSLVINCAGPSCLIREKVAAASVKAGAKYVDTFGTFLIDNAYAQSIRNGVCVVSAGNVPGLSEILPCSLISEYFDEVDEIEVYAGGLDYPTFSSTADVLLSSLEGYGYAGSFYNCGEICSELADTSKRIKIWGFDEEVFAKPFIGSEFAALCKRKGVKKGYCYNTVVSKQLGEAMVNSCIELAAGRAGRSLEKCVEEINTQMELSLFGRKPGYTLVAAVTGSKSGKARTKRVSVKVKSSCEITGIVAGMVAAELAGKDIPCGIYYPFEITDAGKIMAKLLEYKNIFEYTSLDDADIADFEEGTL